MDSNTDDRYTRHPPRRVNETLKDHSNNERKDNNDIISRRPSLAHINFRKAIYRSVSLPIGARENKNIQTICIEYFIKLCFICLLILLIGTLIKLMWS